jgi:hypothetical protein
MTYTPAQLAALKNKGHAMPPMPGGTSDTPRFPINNAKDLSNAISDWGRAGASPAVKAYIISRAKALGLTSSLPANW